MVIMNLELVMPMDLDEMQDADNIGEMLEDDEINAWEEGFMRGYEEEKETELADDE